MKIVGMAQIYNEVETGHLPRCLEHYRKLCDELVILDDASTDGSLELAKQYTPHVIRNDSNGWDKNLETLNKARLLERVLTLNPDWIISFDADEIYEKKLEDNNFLRNMLNWAASKGINSLSFNWYHLWMSECWYRIDRNLSVVSPPRIWRNIGDLRIEVTPGLHQRLCPVQMDKPYYLNLTIMHYSSSSFEKLTNKILNYMRLDSSRNYLSVLDGVTLGEVDYNWFAEQNRPAKEPCPTLDVLHAEIRRRVDKARGSLPERELGKRFMEPALTN